MTRRRLLLVNVFVVATCALVYELVCGTLASYLLGDVVVEFSIVLGVYLSAMGAGAWFSRRFEGRAGERYVAAEIVLAAMGGASVPVLLFAFAAHAPVRPLLYGASFVLGSIAGVELPLLAFVLRGEESFKDLTARTLALDYAGALGASLLFPLVLVPRLGLVRTSLAVGIVNALVALSATFALPLARRALLRGAGIFVLGALVIALASSARWAAPLAN